MAMPPPVPVGRPKTASQRGPSSASCTTPLALTARTTGEPTRSRTSGSTSSPTTTLGMPRLRASSCTWESELPSPSVRMPETGGRSESVSGSR